MPLEAQLRRITIIGEERSVIMAQGDLQIGEQIAVKGAFKLRDGALVKLAATSAGQ